MSKNQAKNWLGRKKVTAEKMFRQKMIRLKNDGHEIIVRALGMEPSQETPGKKIVNEINGQ